jgi:hypothetical protein
MTEGTRQVEVVASEGRHIIGYGSREKGERFTLPVELAKELVKQQPDAFKMVRTKKTEEVEHVN